MIWVMFKKEAIDNLGHNGGVEKRGSRLTTPVCRIDGFYIHKSSTSYEHGTFRCRCTAFAQKLKKQGG